MGVDNILLVLRNDGVLLPVYIGALGQADGWPWTIKRRYSDALVISRSRVTTMAHVHVVGPAGKSTFSRILSVLNSNWLISIHQREKQVSLATVIGSLKAALLTNATICRGLFGRPEAELAAQIDRASSIADLFIVLGLNDPNFIALDSL